MDTASLLGKLHPEKFSRQKVLFGLGMLTILLLLVLLSGDGVLFYKTFIADRVPAEVPLKKVLILSNSEVDEIIKLLDERELKLNAVLGK